jgi:2-oxo-4-hydroxy-4-carboxy-5-ureidoimidazoline decarboxylase
MTISELYRLNRYEFVRLVGPVFEHSPWIAEEAWQHRPFGNRDILRKILCEVVRNSGAEKQITLIRAHPDLVGRAAVAGTLTRASAGEQAAAGLDKLSPEEIKRFQDYNAAYKEKFGFPFVICARLNKKDAILAGFARRMSNSREQEINAALEEIFRIAELRLADLISD